jgi:hypothetical protein
MIETLIQEHIFVNAAVQQFAVTACVEAAHIYSDESPDVTHELAAKVGASTCLALANLGVEVSGLLFVDDYNPSSFDLDLEKYMGMLNAQGFPVSKVVMESSLQNYACCLVDELEANGMTKRKKDGKVYLLGGSQILLKKSDLLGNKPACDVLDAAFYINKSEEAGLCVTVLPFDYREQQEKVKELLKILGYEISILNVYFNQEGEVDLDFNY